MFTAYCQCRNGKYIVLSVGRIGDTNAEAIDRAIKTVCKFKAGYIVHGTKLLFAKGMNRITARKLHHAKTKEMLDIT